MDMNDELILDFDLIKEKIRKNLKAEVKAEIREEIETEVQEEVTAQDQLAIIQKLYSKLNDSEQVALLLDLPLETILAAIQSKAGAIHFI